MPAEIVVEEGAAIINGVAFYFWLTGTSSADAFVRFCEEDRKEEEDEEEEEGVERGLRI